MTTLYGISNCDTVAKAKRWLEANNIEYRFHDFRKDGLEAKAIEQWLEHIGHASLVNKRSTTWKQLSEQEREGVMGSAATKILGAQPTLIKRPVLEHAGSLHVGFKPEQYSTLFNI